MICPQGHNNPDKNKFCGECGAKLEFKARGLALNDYFRERQSAPQKFAEVKPETVIVGGGPAELRTRESGSAGSRSEEPRLVASGIPERPAAPVHEIPPRPPAAVHEGEVAPRGTTIVMETPAPVTARPAPPAQRREYVGISGPSILGLGSSVETSGPDSADYLLEDEPQRSTWRAWALLALLVGIGVLGYMQWRSAHQASVLPNLEKILGGKGQASPQGQQNPSPAAAEPAPQSSNSSADENPTISNGEAAKAPAAQPAQAQPAPPPALEGAGAPDPATATNHNGKAGVVAGDGVTVNAAGGSAQPGQGVTVNSNSAAGGNKTQRPAGSAKPQSDQDQDAPAPRPNMPTAQPKEAKFTQPVPRQPSSTVDPAISLGAKDPLYLQGMSYLQGRGAPRDCQRGVRLLLQSAHNDNPKAAIQLGALYMTGSCVTADRVTAYNWLTRALAVERNKYVQRTRDSLWANMSDSEREAVR